MNEEIEDKVYDTDHIESEREKFFNHQDWLDENKPWMN